MVLKRFLFDGLAFFTGKDAYRFDRFLECTKDKSVRIQIPDISRRASRSKEIKESMSFTEQVGELFEKEGFHVQNLFLSGDSELWEAQYFGDHEILMIAFGGKGMECAERHLSPSISRLTKKGDLKEFIFNKEEREEFLRELPDVFPPLP